MSELPDNSIQMVCTSPPYWGLRKYAGNQDLIWSDTDHCQHEWESETRAGLTGGTNCTAVGGWAGGSRGKEQTFKTITTNTCLKCNAWRGSYGLEPTPELYIQHTIEILNEIKRVLRKDGVCFWNIGDSYAGSGMGAANYPGDYPKQNSNIGTLNVTGRKQFKNDIIKAKDLCLIPFRVAIAAQEAGWWVRSVIIWNKPNPMPESVKDRPTESHEYILMLTKSAKYYYDMEAVREKSLWFEKDNRADGTMHKSKGKCEEDNYAIDGVFYPADGGRNLRSVWTFPTQGYPEAHFATFPEELPERCIKAGTPEYGCCDKCGTPYERIVEKEYPPTDRTPAPNKGRLGAFGERAANMTRDGFIPNREADIKTLGWKQACKCADSKPVPSTVLDPFAGSGTTLLVAAKLGRKAIGYEISEPYVKLIIDRNRQMALSEV